MVDSIYIYIYKHIYIYIYIYTYIYIHIYIYIGERERERLMVDSNTVHTMGPASGGFASEAFLTNLRSEERLVGTP